MGIQTPWSCGCCRGVVAVGRSCGSVNPWYFYHLGAQLLSMCSEVRRSPFFLWRALNALALIWYPRVRPSVGGPSQWGGLQTPSLGVRRLGVHLEAPFISGGLSSGSPLGQSVSVACGPLFRGLSMLRWVGIFRLDLSSASSRCVLGVRPSLRPGGKEGPREPRPGTLTTIPCRDEQRRL